jgi:hypothetical protein
MGSAVDSLTGKSSRRRASKAGRQLKDAFIEGGDIRAGGIQQAIDQLMGGQAGIQGMLDPFTQAGLGGLEQLQQGSTPEGMNAMLEQIMGGGAFQSLVDERSNAMQGQLSAGGLTRSGTALEEMAQIPVDTALGLDGLLSSRAGSLADMGAQTAGQQFNNQASFEQLIAQLLSGKQDALASGLEIGEQARVQGRLAGLQAGAQGQQNLFNLAGDIAPSFLPKPT